MVSFFYTNDGDKMVIYIDVLLIFNFIIDLLLLLSVAVTLKRNVSFYSIVSGAFIGSFSILLLFYNFNNIELFFLKLLISVFMILVAFKYRDIKYFIKNLGYLYFSSLILGGGIYLFNNMVALENNNFKFISNSYQLNFIGMLILSPILIAYYVRKIKTLKEYNEYRYYTSIKYKGNNIEGIGYIDSGNCLMFKRKPVVLVSKRLINFEIEDYSLLPYQALNYIGIVKCFKVESLKYNSNIIKNIYLGVMDNEVGFDGIDFLLNKKMMEG